MGDRTVASIENIYGDNLKDPEALVGSLPDGFPAWHKWLPNKVDYMWTLASNR
jgi:hypothetical protein